VVVPAAARERSPLMRRPVGLICRLHAASSPSRLGLAGLFQEVTAHAAINAKTILSEGGRIRKVKSRHTSPSRSWAGRSPKKSPIAWAPNESEAAIPTNWPIARIVGRWGIAAFPGQGFPWLSLWQQFVPKSTQDLGFADFPDSLHPLVLEHPITGRRSLNISPMFLERVHGMAPEESDALLRELVAHVTRPEFCYLHTWTPGEMILWDNWRFMHSAPGIKPGDRRLIHRTTILGDAQLGRVVT